MSGQGRYGPVTPVALVTSKEGKELIDTGMAFTRDEFARSMARIRKAMAYTDAEVMEERPLVDTPNAREDLSIIRHYFHGIGQYAGPDIILYNGDGEGIRSQHDLDNALNNYGTPLPKGQKLYVVPADVHF